MSCGWPHLTTPRGGVPPHTPSMPVPVPVASSVPVRLTLASAPPMVEAARFNRHYSLHDHVL
jgi:hypothetical protein